MRLLITGGAGCLGAAIAERTLARGGFVLALDNFATGARDALAPHANLTIMEGTIADAATVDAAFAGFAPTHVVHSAASYKNPDDWAEDIATNVAGTAHTVAAATRHDVQRFIYLNTALVYGRARQTPIAADHPLDPFTSYAISKAAGERYVMLSGLSWVSLRLANIYGPRHYSGPIPTFYKRLKAGQPCTVVATRRDFVEMEDFLDLIDRIVERPTVTGAFNVASARDYAIAETFARVAAALGVPDDRPQEIPHEGDDVASLMLDPSATEAAFGWKARVSFDEGLKRQIDWYEAHGVGDTFTHLNIGRK